jgi:translation initiation factor 2 alpha subunit (eIF-2alpha)
MDHKTSLEEKLHTLARVTALGGDDRVIEQTVTKLLAYTADRHRQDLEDIATKLRDLEAHFGMASAQFAEQFQRGELGDDETFFRWDALLEMQRRVKQRLALLQGDASP